MLALLGCSSGRSNPPVGGEAQPASPVAVERSAPATPLPPPSLEPVVNRDTEARLLVGTLAPGDPLRLALRWKGRTAVDYAQRPNTADTMRTITATLKGPGGEQILRPDARALASSGWAQGSIILELSTAGLTEKTTGLSMPWLAGAAPDMSAPGAYTVSLAGETVAGPARAPFESAPLTVIVSADRPSLTALEQVARAELARQEPVVASKPEALQERTESGFVAGVAIEIAPGKLRFRYAVMDSFRWGYDLHSITVGVDRSIADVARKSIHTCIASGVLVDGEHGPRAVETLAVGDRIYGYDFERQARVLVTVRDVWAGQADALVEIGALRVTGNHPLYLDGTWQPAAAVRPGAVLLGVDGHATAVAQVGDIAHQSAVYNLTVDGPHNYFAGGYLVHNKDRGYRSELDDPWLFMWSDDPG